MTFDAQAATDKYQARPQDAPRELYQSRLEICQACPRREAHTCKRANQLVTIMARRDVMKCPERRWPDDTAKPSPLVVNESIFRRALNSAKSLLSRRFTTATKAGRANSRRIRVALLSPSFVLGGAERWMISLGRTCDRNLIDWTGLVLCDGAQAESSMCAEMAEFMPILAGPGTPKMPHIVPVESERDALSRIHDQSDVLVTWGMPDMQKRLPDGWKIPVVFASHGCGEWTERCVQSSESGCTHFTAVSETAILPFSRPVQQRATVIHNGIDVERCTPSKSREEIRAGWGFTADEILIGYVGRYSYEKNPLAAAQAACELGGRYRAIYVGSGWKEAEVKADVLRIAGDRCKFIPPITRIGDALAGLDAFVLASPSEGFSLGLLEAWYCGLPTVATQVGAVPELEREYGPLVSPVPINPSPASLAAAVQHALTDDFRSRIVPRARLLTGRLFTTEAMARMWSDYLVAIVRESKL